MHRSSTRILLSWLRAQTSMITRWRGWVRALTQLQYVNIHTYNCIYFSWTPMHISAYLHLAEAGETRPNNYSYVPANTVSSEHWNQLSTMYEGVERGGGSHLPPPPPHPPNPSSPPSALILPTPSSSTPLNQIYHCLSYTVLLLLNT